ncbi:hypothetical protein ES332_A05G257600v1 [Gossypium tomentosum]|uniref:Uncharacterized protein n=1 Tax=Gossypium tomentosum TaxID=34277 RepID=A0A5D2QJ04_GOSTO|nr:hypothetical protein ES332_A05G257600v1 [Gossypium tomentosum]
MQGPHSFQPKNERKRSFYPIFGINSVDGDEAPTARLRGGPSVRGALEACEAGDGVWGRSCWRTARGGRYADLGAAPEGLGARVYFLL